MSASPSINVPLSLAERDRRWAAVRRAMESVNVDCVVAPPISGSPVGAQPDAGYLTGSGSAGAGVVCIVPLDGEVTAIIARCGRRPELRAWVGDVREAGTDLGQATVQRLREMSLPRRRVGVVGLGGSRSAPDGTAPHGFVSAMHHALPHLEWLDFTDALHAVRMVKSPEEIDVLRRAALLVDRAFERAALSARPGIRDYEVWAAAIGELLRGGSEVPVQNRWGAGPRPGLFARPSHGILQRGYLIVNELEASVSGYRAEGSQPIAVEGCDPIFKDLYAMYRDYWQLCLESLRVGTTLGEVEEACHAAAAKLAPAEGRYAGLKGRLLLRGEGLEHAGASTASTGPTARARIDAARRAGARTGRGFQPPLGDDTGVTLAAGWAFAFKPALELAIDGRSYRTAWGDTLVLREGGPERLGTRRPGLVTVGG